VTIDETIREIAGEMSHIFRHLVPGVLIFGIAYLSHPSWMNWIKIDTCTHWIVLFILSIVAGNTWYVIHRFTVHNIIDFFCFLGRRKNEKNNKKENDLKISKINYQVWLSNHIQNSFTQLNGEKKELKKYVHFRSSQVHLLFIFSEAIFLFTIWREKINFIGEYQLAAIILGSIIFITAIVQYWIGFNIDIDITSSDKSTE
jgi:hypothetical protein